MRKAKDFYVVGIGASAGGLDAVQQFFSKMENNSGIAFIVVQHLSPDFKSLMPELLGKYTKMQIYTAENNMEIKPNCIYLNQRNTNLIIKKKRLFLVKKESKDHLNLPIDLFFHSLGEEFKEKSIGVILSGTGSDGSRGIKTIKENGGIVLVQDPLTAQFDGMPKSAIFTNITDFILPPQELAKKILQFTQKKINILPELTKENEIEEIYKLILNEILSFSGVDFKKYKNNTLVRRLEKRMTLHNFNKLDEYYNFLKINEEEKNALKQEFLIGVTSFFRDKEAFNVLSSKVIPEICQSKKTSETIRIWIPGCSTGEEAYSIAILFDNYIRDNKTKIDFKIFATDIDKKALEKASTGSFPVNNFTEIDKNYFEDYFFKTGDQIQIIKRIREKIVFSLHDVTSDPPFIRIDLISCRNLLIYLTNDTQKKVLDNFQYSLNKDGFLFLGSSESLGINNKNFITIDSKWKIFKNTKDNFRIFLNKNTKENQTIKRYEDYIQETLPNPQRKFLNKLNENIFYKYLTKKYAPITIFIDKEYNILFIQGNFKKWFNPREGLYSNNILNLVNTEMASVIRNAIRQVKETKNSISIKNLLYKINDEEYLNTNLYFELANVLENNNEIFLIQFGENTEIVADQQVYIKNTDISEYSRQRIEELENELKETKSELQNVIEELEASNEELQSANEELMSSNEELQSANEELQSVNEELYTVNTEFQEKNKELTILNNDITNLLNSIDVGTLFLDKDLNIRKFSKEINRVFKLEDSDIGRSIIAFASAFPEKERQQIINEAKNALDNLESSESEIQDNECNWYLKKVKPFVTSEKAIEGVLITFININNIKQTTQKLKQVEERLSLSLEAGNIAWWEMELPSGNVNFSKNKVLMIGHDPNNFKDYKDFMKIVHPEDYDKAMNAMYNLLNGSKELYDCEYRIKNNKGEYQWFHDIGKITYRNDDNIIISGVVKEITQNKNLEFNLIEAIKKAEIANIYKNQFLANMSHEIRTPMNAIIGFSNLLKNPKLDDKIKHEYCEIIENSSYQLLNLINDIIEISKIEAGELKINYQDCNLYEIFTKIETTYNQIKIKKEKENIDLKLKVIPRFRNIIIKTDPYRLQQILNNLLDNAIKFTDAGYVEFGYSIEKDSLKVFVSDTGIGIPEDKINLVFERFFRIEKNNTNKYDGTGLGLAIVKGIIDLLKGKITIDSKENLGTKVTFIIPIEIIQQNKNIQPFIYKRNNEFSKMEAINVLIAEDDLNNIQLFNHLLKDLSINVYFAKNGEEAINIYKQNNNIDLILMDLRMPIMDGVEATKRILEINPNAKIIAQTAYAMAEDKIKCLQNGFCDYISKPIIKEELISKIIKWTENLTNIT